MSEDRRALVLGGGGLAGIAWETGVLLGISDVAPEVGRALVDSDVLVGTSAGAAVAAQISSSMSLEELFDRQLSAESAEIDPGVEIDDVARLFLAAMLTPNATKAEKLRKIGAVAAQADTVSEAVRREVIAHRLPSLQWPDRDLRLTAIDIDTGELLAFGRRCGVELVDAVAASCAVPGAWPPVTIGGGRYLDGGVASTVNMIFAADCATAVVLVPAAADAPSPWGVSTAEEIAAADGRALAIFADAGALAAFGRNPLDPACRIPSAQAGRAQGRREAARIATFLGL